MKKVLTIVVDESISKEIFEQYYDLADFISIETEAEYNMKHDGWTTWDGEEAGFDLCDVCGEDECDCDTRI